jgi:hypothetical protein
MKLPDVRSLPEEARKKPRLPKGGNTHEMAAFRNPASLAGILRQGGGAKRLSGSKIGDTWQEAGNPLTETIAV